MPWKESSVVEERLRFVARLLDGEAMTDLCREFGISRKTGYKIFDRYKEHGLQALTPTAPADPSITPTSSPPRGCLWVWGQLGSQRKIGRCRLDYGALRAFARQPHRAGICGAPNAKRRCSSRVTRGDGQA